MTSTQARQFIEKFDANGDGVLSIEEFVKAFTGSNEEIGVVRTEIVLHEAKAPKEAEKPSATPQFEAYKFTPAQQAAAAMALAAQEKVAAAAEAASAEEKAKVSTQWKVSCGGPSLERMLEDMTLVDVQYLIALTEAGGVVPRYQELPAAARIGPHNAWRLRCWSNAYRLPVLVLS